MYCNNVRDKEINCITLRKVIYTTLSVSIATVHTCPHLFTYVLMYVRCSSISQQRHLMMQRMTEAWSCTSPRWWISVHANSGIVISYLTGCDALTMRADSLLFQVITRYPALQDQFEVCNIELPDTEF